MFSMRDRALANSIVSNIRGRDVSLKFMHVCGTHQDTLVKHGLNALFESCGIEIGQGPGCPVCVTTAREIEEMMQLARAGKTVASFGDMINVPGGTGSLQSVRAEGFAVRTVYSIEDAVSFAQQHPEKEVVFVAVGFETTAPTTASVLLQEPPDNFSILCCHRVIPPALQAILDMGELRLDGLIEPGHVSAIIGEHPYEFISRDYRMPQVIAGFEPLDLLMAVWLLVQQIEQDSPRVENEYARVVATEGNAKALNAMNKVFRTDDVKWRGFPVIPQSGLFLNDAFARYDARIIFEDDLVDIHSKEFQEPAGCRCGELLRGLVSPQECPLFGKQCTPGSPVGPCMVSIEGSCNIEYRYASR